MRLLAGMIACALGGGPLLAQGGFTGAGVYEIMNIKSGKVLDLDRNDQSTVIQFASRGTDNQTWEVRSAAGGFYYLLNGMNGYALDAGRAGNSEPLRGLPFNGRESQQWRIEPGKDGNALIVSRLGRTIDIPDGTDRDGARVQVYDLNGDSNQRFTFRRVSGGRIGGGRRGGWRDRDREDYRPERGGETIVCSSNDGGRVYCDADTRNGVVLVRQISGSACREGSTWGFDRRGIWVDRGCRAEFRVETARRGVFGGSTGASNTVVCSSNNGERVFCDVDTRGRSVEMVRQISGSPCRQGSTWGYDRRGIWVDRGCRAEFAVRDDR